MPSALPGFRIVATVRQVWNIFDHVDCVRCVPQFGTRGVNRDRAETHVENAADALFGKASRSPSVSVQRSAWSIISRVMPYFAAHCALSSSMVCVLVIDAVLS